MNPTKDIFENGSDQKLKDQFGKEMPYIVPDGYFDHFPEQVLDAIKKKPVRKTFILGGFRKIAAVAAVFILAAMVISYIFSYRSDEVDDLNDFSMLDIYEYNINSLVDLEEAYLFSLLEDDLLDLQSFLVPDTSGISDEFIIDYLLAENHIEYLIINEY